MITKKPWTVMIYLAADNNLANFGIDSLRQMKATSNRNINVVAEFDTGPGNRNQRYAFTGSDPYGDIRKDVVDTFGPTSAADPENLSRFITWGAQQYPADHHFVIIWGHGGGIDDDFPNADNSFVPRHKLLNLFTVDGGEKGIFHDPGHGIFNDPGHSIFNSAPTMVGGRLYGVIEGQLKNLVDVFNLGDQALHCAIIGAVQKGIEHALGEKILNQLTAKGLIAFGKAGLDSAQVKKLEDLRTMLLDSLKNGALDKLQNGALQSARQRILLALRKGIADALQTGVILELQTAVLTALQNTNTQTSAERICDVLGQTILRCLENGIVHILEMGVSNPTREISRQVKSLAFSDHPMSFLTSRDLQNALAVASQKLGRRIDIFGMDSCNMNMIEIGYGLRNSVNFMVASQDSIPDASLPYDKIIARLVAEPDIEPKELAALTATTFRAAYADYTEPPNVALSVLNLTRSQEVVPLFHDFVGSLRKACKTFDGRDAVQMARAHTRNFGDNQFIDLIQFCGLLASAPDLDLADAASQVIAPLRDIISANETSENEKNCNGTSIYLPEFNRKDTDHDKRLAHTYNQLEFVGATGWGSFIADFLELGKEESAVEDVLVAAASGSNRHSKNHKTDPASKETVSHLSKAEENAAGVVAELTFVAELSETNATATAAVVQVSKVIESRVSELVRASKNGGFDTGRNGNGGNY